jgi:hypothetical protein
VNVSEIEPPPRDEIRAALLAVLSSGAEAPPADRLARIEIGDDGVRYEPAGEELLASLWRPDPIEQIEIEEVRCQYHPVWRVAYRPVTDGRKGALLVSEVLPLEKGGPLRVLARWRPAIEGDDGSLRPNFRPDSPGPAGARGDGARVAVVAHPPWTDLRIEER